MCHINQSQRQAVKDQEMIDIGWDERVYPVAKIAVVIEGLAAEGVSAAAALEGAGIAPDELRSPATLVSVTQVIQAYRNAMRLSRDTNFAFLSGLKTHVSSFGMYGFAILSSMNFRQTMHFAVRYHQLATPLVELRFAEEGARAAWTIDPLPHPAVDGRLYRFIVELQFGIVTSIHRDVMGLSFNPAVLQVKFDPIRPEAQYERDFGCPVAFQQPANRLVFDAAWLDGTPMLGNEVAYASVLKLCEDLHDRLQHRVGVAGKVRGFLLGKLGRPISLEDVASHFDIPERTLRRKLRGEGTSFRGILDQLRAEVATKYLRDTQMTVDDIATALGFSETANFRHAFHRWKRASPRAFRQTLQDERAAVRAQG
jgi:AraC-like DNA-binding protein